jgi:hypothetical protein
MDKNSKGNALGPRWLPFQALPNKTFATVTPVGLMPFVALEQSNTMSTKNSTTALRSTGSI